MIGKVRQLFLNRRYQRFFPLLSLVGIVACTRTCVGIPEIGSQQTPVRLFLSSRLPLDKEVLDTASQCIENAVRYRVRFEVVADERAALSALGRGEAHIAYLTPMNFVDASAKFSAVAHRVRLEAGSPANRSVIIGMATLWAAHFEKQRLPLSAASLRTENALEFISSGRFLFSDSESDLGFFVPRHLLFQRDVFPEEAVFAGSDDLVAQGLERNLGAAGAVSEAWLRQKYGVDEVLRPGMEVGPFWVLDVSPSLPGKVLASRPDFSAKIRDQVLMGIDTCSVGAAQPAMVKIFGGESFGTASERTFVYARELRETQDTFLRVVEPEAR